MSEVPASRVILQSTSPDVLPQTAELNHAQTFVRQIALSADKDVSRGSEAGTGVQSEPAFAETRVLRTSAQMLEVGIASGSHGWLRIRAEMNGSHAVSGSLVTTSADRGAALRSLAPALQAYLSQADVPLASLRVIAPDLASQNAVESKAQGDADAHQQRAQADRRSATDGVSGTGMETEADLLQLPVDSLQPQFLRGVLSVHA